MPASASSETLLDRTVGATSMATPLRIAAVMLGVAVTALAAQFTVPSPISAVPFALTPLAVVLTGAALGSRLGAVAQVSYVLLGVLGLAVFAPSPTLPSGALRVIGPTGGYLMAYPVAAFVAGWLAEHGWGRRYVTSFGAMLAGMVVIHVGGVAWLALAFMSSVTSAALVGSAQFLLVDVAKAVAAALILPQAWRLVGSSDAGPAR